MLPPMVGQSERNVQTNYRSTSGGGIPTNSKWRCHSDQDARQVVGASTMTTKNKGPFICLTLLDASGFTRDPSFHRPTFSTLPFCLSAFWRGKNANSDLEEKEYCSQFACPLILFTTCCYCIDMQKCLVNWCAKHRTVLNDTLQCNGHCDTTTTTRILYRFQLHLTKSFKRNTSHSPLKLTVTEAHFKFII